MASRKTVIVLSGPAGTGKSTIANLLQSKLGASFLEGDDFHPQKVCIIV